jgi:flavin-dependent dehydrogenase
MNRREFIKICQLLGLSLPLSPLLNVSAKGLNNTDSVLIIGAGAAGLSAAYLLEQQGVNYQILEASATFGGRIKHTTDFTDFPIPLVAEWIHVSQDILNDIVNDDSISLDIKTTLYDREADYGLYDGERISIDEAELTEDSKFINSSWFDFFVRYIVPSVEHRIRYNSLVTEIDYSSDEGGFSKNQ